MWILLLVSILFSCESEDDKRSKKLLSGDIWKIDATYKNLLASLKGEEALKQEELRDYYDARGKYFEKISTPRESYNITEKYLPLNSEIENLLQVSKRIVQTRFAMRVTLVGAENSVKEMNKSADDYNRYFKNGTTYYRGLASKAKQDAMGSKQKILRSSTALIDLQNNYDSLVAALNNHQVNINSIVDEFNLTDRLAIEFGIEEVDDFLISAIEDYDHAEMALIAENLDSRFTAQVASFRPQLTRALLPHEKKYSSYQYETEISTSHAYLKSLPQGPESKRIMTADGGAKVFVYNTENKEFYYVKIGDKLGYINKWDLAKN
jgi:hypothetical protein